MFYELTPVYDSRKSFYRKAFVEVEENTTKLYSYNSMVCQIVNGVVEMMEGGSLYDSYTTRRHKREFLRQNGFDAEQYM